MSSNASEIEMNDFENQERVYQLYRQTDGACLFATNNVEGWKKVHIDVPRKGIQRLKKLPAYPAKHVRGFLGSRYAHFLVKATDESLPLRNRSWGLHRRYDLPKRIIFHSKPTKDVYSDIPDRVDLYNFLKYRHSKQIFIGRSVISILEKVDATNETIIRLWDWEEVHSYKMKRIQKRRPNESSWQHLERYAAAALRGIGLKWPGKLSKRRKHWPDCFRELGLDVLLVDR